MGQATRLDEPGGRVVITGSHSDGIVRPLLNQNRDRVLVHVQQLDLQLSPAWEPGADADDVAPGCSCVAAIRYIKDGEHLRVQGADCNRLLPALAALPAGRGAPVLAGDYNHAVGVFRKLKFLRWAVSDSDISAAAAVGRQIGVVTAVDSEVSGGPRPVRSAGNKEETTECK